MGVFNWLDSKVKKFRWFDIGFVKLSVLAFTLMLAKLWPAFLSLDWYIYLIIALFSAIRPYYVMLRRDNTK